MSDTLTFEDYRDIVNKARVAVGGKPMRHKEEHEANEIWKFATAAERERWNTVIARVRNQHPADVLGPRHVDAETVQWTGQFIDKVLQAVEREYAVIGEAD